MSEPSAITIRGARPDDAPDLGRLGALLVKVHHEFDPDRFVAPGPGTERGYGGFLAGQLDRKDIIVLVAEQQGAVLGYAYAGLEGNDWMALRGPAGVIYDLVVDPAHRRQGIGRRLLEAAVETLSVRGAPRFLLSTAARNETAQKLFESAGFRRTMIEMTRERNDPAER
ncbi:MAG TPA: GNAT family N-acetyltransferase [Caulobacteraceae bacterium]|jgi:ribosomal protein S18 acetylase RimI-like enzyme|nr:GNAT family N-acetyltransferase [Caulobacteraceae bacterium]